ncbi:hypothetical protein [Streptomyces albidoflavus]|uniref:hypothetical protein n=1 Tax=Streptomyces albidoflavus TaxID=1886 RepID=UPI0008F53B78|nr:hypothetical protein [Streptomyces albidoflavus]
MNTVDVAVPYLICFTLLGAGISLAFDLFGIRKFLTGEGSPFSEWRHSREAFVSVASQVIGVLLVGLAALGILMITESLYFPR